jgi:hypothetical protein
MLRGVAVQGAGASRTIIAGSRLFDPRAKGGAYGDRLYATIVMGDNSRATRLAGFTLQPGRSNPGPYYYGVYCAEGNAAAADANPTEPNTVLDDLVIGPEYDTGLVATTSTKPVNSGCNVRVTRTSFERSYTGIWAFGCNPTAGHGTPNGEGEVPVALELGDGTAAGGNTFHHQDLPDNNATGVSVGGCVTHVSVRYNVFNELNGGVYIEQPLGSGPANRNHFFFENNTFERLSTFGLYVRGGAIRIEKLQSNRFSEITTVYRPGTGYQGLGIGLDGLSENAMPLIVKARNNVFVANDAAMAIHSPNYLPSFPKSDFGTPEDADAGTSFDPGNNVFSCNSEPAGADVVASADIIIQIDQAPVPVPFFFAGNVWDRVQPSYTRFPLDSQFNGYDIATSGNVFVPLRTEGARKVDGADSACPDGRVR